LESNDSDLESDHLNESDKTNVCNMSAVNNVISTIRSGRRISKPSRYREETGRISMDNWEEYAMVGAGLLDDSVSTTAVYRL
jgi:hypothetical protein